MKIKKLFKCIILFIIFCITFILVCNSYDGILNVFASENSISLFTGISGTNGDGGSLKNKGYFSVE